MFSERGRWSKAQIQTVLQTIHNVAAASQSEIKFLWTAEFAICHFNLQSKLGIVPIIMWNINRERKNDWILEYFRQYHHLCSHTVTVKMLKCEMYLWGSFVIRVSPLCFSILVKWDKSVILPSFPRVTGWSWTIFIVLLKRNVKTFNFSC